MDIDIARNKIKLCIIGSGDWGSQVAEVVNLFERFELIGTINSSTEESLKNSLLSQAQMVYIAIPKEAQLEYVNYCIEHDKYTICESPFLNSLEERKAFYEKMKEFKPRLFFINSAYFMDTDFARVLTTCLASNTKFIKIKCSGPKFKDQFLTAKKYYSNQAIFLLIQIAVAKKMQRFSQYSIYNDYSGEFYENGATFQFEWGFSENSQNTIQIHTESNVMEKTLIYDKYDHIYPMLKFASDQYYKIFPPPFSEKPEKEINDVLREVNFQSLLTSCTAENFSDQFCSLEHQTIISDPTKLFFNGGF